MKKKCAPPPTIGVRGILELCDKPFHHAELLTLSFVFMLHRFGYWLLQGVFSFISPSLLMLQCTLGQIRGSHGHTDTIDEKLFI